MNIWLDLANAPHVNFFKPILDELTDRGHDIEITIRDFNQTVQLAALSGIKGTVCGTHGGKGVIRKIVNLFSRGLSLYNFSRKKGFSVAISHNSYSQIIAAKLHSIPVVTFMDFEGQPANHIAFRLADTIVVPDFFKNSDLNRLGAKQSRVKKFEGFKEQVYLSDYQPDAMFISKLKDACCLPPDFDLENKILITVRAPADLATYHTFENTLFSQIVEIIQDMNNVVTIVLPRYEQQKISILKQFRNVNIPAKALSGADLVYYSDMVFSAGGTMNREAAVLGTPAYTIYAGTLPNADIELIKMGRMYPVKCIQDLDQIEFTKKNRKPVLHQPALTTHLVDMIEDSSSAATAPAFRTAAN